MDTWDFTILFLKWTGIIVGSLLLLAFIAAFCYVAYYRWGHHVGRARTAIWNKLDLPTALISIGFLTMEIALWHSGRAPALFHFWWILANIVVVCALWYALTHLVKEERLPYAAWGVATVGVVLMCAALSGSSVRFHTPQGGGTQVAKNHPPAEDPKAPTALTTPAALKECPGVARRVMVGNRWTPVNPDYPNAQCDFAFEIKSGKIALKSPDGNPVHKIGFVGQEGPQTITEIRSSEGNQAIIVYMLCPYGKGPRDGGWSCRS